MKKKSRMDKKSKIALIAGGSLAAIGGLVYLGLKTPPGSFPPPEDLTRLYDRVDFSGDFPDPVKYHLTGTFGEKVPVINTAIVWGQARYKINGLNLPMRFKTHYIPGQHFYRDMEVTWYGRPIIRGYDYYLLGEGRLEANGLMNLYHAGEKTNQAQVLSMWAEAMWMPSIFITDDRLRWEEIDDVTARLVFPINGGEESLLARFDKQTGILRYVSGMRYRNEQENRIPWRVDYSGWTARHGVRIPRKMAASWADQDSPYATYIMEGIEYNVDVSEKIPQETVPRTEAGGEAA
jgi:hypothetical protein